jgi:hypothetical protein
MAIYEWAMSGNPSRYKNRLVVTESAPDYAANTRTITWSLYIVSYDNAYPAWNTDNNGSRSVTIAGETWASSFGFDFRPASSTKVILLASGTKVITHNASGYATISISSSLDSNNQYVGSGGGSTSLALTRISQVPQAPGGLTPGATSPTTVALSWTTPEDGGAALTGYEVQYATDAGFTTGLGSQAFAGTSGTVTGLTPGAGYHFRVRAENARGCNRHRIPGTPRPYPQLMVTEWLRRVSSELERTGSRDRAYRIPPTGSTKRRVYRRRSSAGCGRRSHRDRDRARRRANLLCKGRRPNLRRSKHLFDRPRCSTHSVLWRPRRMDTTRHQTSRD